MKFAVFITLILSTFYPVFAEGYKNYQKEDFEKMKLMKIEYLNKKINCVTSSKNFREMKKCLGKKKKY